MSAMGSKEVPAGKSGNAITRMYARTGWWPLKRESETWQRAISQFSVAPHGCNTSGITQDQLTDELGPDVKIRKVVLAAFRGQFLTKAEKLKQAYKDKNKRRKSSVPGTVNDKGFCKKEDLTVVKANDERLDAKAEAKVSLTPSLP